jgi:hypothetical protein
MIDFELKGETMTARAPIFDTILSDYLARVACLDKIEHRCHALGITWEKGRYRVPFFNRKYTLTADTVSDDAGRVPHHAISVVLCQYLLLYSDLVVADDSLVTYKDFRDAGPYVGGFKNTAEMPIARHFSNDMQRLERHCRRLGGRLFDTDVACQMAMQFAALPRVPVFLLFHDADEEFPAQCTLLFRKDAAFYLDMECLAMVASSLAFRLQGG